MGRRRFLVFLPRSLLVLTFVLLAGCVGPDVRPSADTLARVREIYVVPMQSPRFELSEWSFATTQSRPGSLPPPPGGPPAAQGAAAGLFYLSQIPTKPDNVEALLREAQSKLDALSTWNPAVGLSQEAARLLSESGRVATAVAEVKTLPKADADSLRLLAWYNSDTPAKGYENLGEKEGAVVAEIGMRYGALTADVLYVEVRVKLVNAKSGEMIGRTRRSISSSNMPFPRLPPMDQALADDAKQLRGIVAGTGNLFVRLCLQDLGFLPISAARK